MLVCCVTYCRFSTVIGTCYLIFIMQGHPKKAKSENKTQKVNRHHWVRGVYLGIIKMPKIQVQIG